MKTVLILAEYFPPSFSIGGKRPYRFARYLPEHGWRPVVITKTPPDPARQDTTPHPLPEEAILSRTLLPGWWKEGTGKPTDGTSVKPTIDKGTQGSWWDRLKNQFDYPFNKRQLFRSAMTRNIARLAEEYSADAIFSTSSPYDMLPLGVAAKKATQLPLILDLRDPWSLNFLLRNKPARFMRAVKKIERHCLTAADRVTFTCEETSKAYRLAYPELPEGHIHTIYNSFDPALKPDTNQELSPQLIELMHFGNCYGPRRLEAIIRAMDLLRQRKIPGAEKLRLVNLGRPAQADLDLLAELGMEDVFSWEPFVPYEEGLKRLANSAAQILMAYGEETLYIPAKIFDYFLTEAPILCVSGSDELRQMVHGTGSGLTAGPNDIPAIAEMLERVIKQHEGQELPFERVDANVHQYASPSTAGQLAALLNELAG